MAWSMPHFFQRHIRKHLNFISRPRRQNKKSEDSSLPSVSGTGRREVGSSQAVDLGQRAPWSGTPRRSIDFTVHEAFSSGCSHSAWICELVKCAWGLVSQAKRGRRGWETFHESPSRRVTWTHMLTLGTVVCPSHSLPSTPVKGAGARVLLGLG